MFVSLKKCEQNWDLSSKILSKIGQKKKLLERKIGGRKSKIDLSLDITLNCVQLCNMVKPHNIKGRP